MTTDQSTAAMLPPRSLDQEGGPCRDCADCRHWRPATLAGLRDGSLVAVPKPIFQPRFWSSGIGPGGVRYFAVEWPLANKADRNAMLAAAETGR